MIHWEFKHPRATKEILGYLPEMLHEQDPRPAKEQLNSNYQHGGGWRPFKGFKMLPNGNLEYPGDPETRLLAETRLREETIRFYERSWVAIVQSDGTYEICRLD